MINSIPPPAPVTIATLPSNLRLSLLCDIIVFFDKKLYADLDLNSSKYRSQSILQSTAWTVKGVDNKIAQIWEVFVISLAKRNWLITVLFIGSAVWQVTKTQLLLNTKWRFLLLSHIFSKWDNNKKLWLKYSVWYVVGF